MTVITVKGNQVIKCDGCGARYPATITNEDDRLFVEELAQSKDYQQDSGVWVLGFDDYCPHCAGFYFADRQEAISDKGCFDGQG